MLAREGHPVNVSCIVNPGNAPTDGRGLEIEWLRRAPTGDLRPVKGLDTLTTDDGNLKSSFLLVKEAKDETLVCSSFNGIGETDREDVKVRLMTKPAIEEPRALAMFGFAIGQDEVELRCKARGKPLPTFYWFHKERQISGNEERFTISEGTYDEVKEARLAVKRLNENDVNSKYKCVAYNELGKDHREIILRRNGKPDPPLNIRVANVSWNSVHLKWDAGFDGGHPQWFTVRVNEQHEKQVRDVEVQLTGLKANKEYQITITSENSAFGTSTESQSLLVTTPEREDVLLDEEDKGRLVGGQSGEFAGGVRTLVANRRTLIFGCLGLVAFGVLGALLLLILVVKKRQKDEASAAATGNDAAGKGGTGNGTPSKTMAINQSDCTVNHRGEYGVKNAGGLDLDRIEEADEGDQQISCSCLIESQDINGVLRAKEQQSNGHCKIISYQDVTGDASFAVIAEQVTIDGTTVEPFAVCEGAVLPPDVLLQQAVGNGHAAFAYAHHHHHGHHHHVVNGYHQHNGDVKLF